jgi:hypothetical protein
MKKRKMLKVLDETSAAKFKCQAEKFDCFFVQCNSEMHMLDSERERALFSLR